MKIVVDDSKIAEEIYLHIEFDLKNNAEFIGEAGRVRVVSNDEEE